MTAALVARLREAGATLRAEHGRLFLRMPEDFPADLLADAKARKPELLDALAAESRPDAPEREPVPQSIPQAATASGLLSASRKRPPSWSDPAAVPSPGCHCHCCGGRAWWSEAEHPTGWRCATCHPPVLGWPVRDAAT